MCNNLYVIACQIPDSVLSIQTENETEVTNLLGTPKEKIILKWQKCSAIFWMEEYQFTGSETGSSRIQ